MRITSITQNINSKLNLSHIKSVLYTQPSDEVHFSAVKEKVNNKAELDQRKQIKKFIDEKLKGDVKKCSIFEIYKAAGIGYTSAKERKELGYTGEDNGFIQLHTYKQPSPYFSFADLGIDEGRLLNSVDHISNDADFSGCYAKSASRLNEIAGNANFKNSQNIKFPRLCRIGKNATFKNSQITDLPALQSIGGNVDFTNSELTTLPKLNTIMGNVDFSKCKITSTPELFFIGGNAKFKYSLFKELPKLNTILGYADFSGCKFEELPVFMLKGGVSFANAEIKSLPRLRRIYGDADFRGAQIGSIPYLQNVPGKTGKIFIDEYTSPDLVDLLDEKGFDIWFVENSEQI